MITLITVTTIIFITTIILTSQGIYEEQEKDLELKHITLDMLKTLTKTKMLLQ